MGGRFVLRLTALAIAALIILPARAAEITCAQAVEPDEYVVEYFKARGRGAPTGVCLAISIRGQIVEGDYDKFRSLLKNHHPFVRLLYITSPGGNVFEAIRIGHLVRRALLATWAPSRGIRGGFLLAADLTLCDGPDCLCASACFLIWSAGVHRIGEFVGVHRPRVSDSHYGTLSATEAATLHARIMRDVSAYFEALGLPRRYFETMERTNSADMHWLTDAEIEADFQGYIPAIAEWLRGNCGSLTRVERETLNEATWRVLNGRGTADDRASHSRLLRKETEIAGCEFRKLFESRHAVTIN